MQCKDVPTGPILRFLADKLNDSTLGDKHAQLRATWTTHWDAPHLDWSIPMPSGLPSKLRLAKMRQLAKRGLVEGCGCGCRGDWVILDKGLALIGIDRATLPPKARPERKGERIVPHKDAPKCVRALR